MSKYTTLLRWIVEQSESEFTSKPNKGQFHAATYAKIGLDKYPIFEEDYRTTLNDKIINHYYFNEIGAETAEQFAWFLRAKMNEIMPYYNKLYKQLMDMTDPFTDYERHKEGWRDYNHEDTYNDTRTQSRNLTREESWNDHNETDNQNRSVFQDTPMSLIPQGSIQGLDYATNVTYDTGGTRGDGSGTRNTTDGGTSDNKHTGNETHTDDDKYGERITGRNKSYVAFLKEYQDSIIDVDVMILQAIECCFMGLW